MCVCVCVCGRTPQALVFECVVVCVYMWVCMYVHSMTLHATICMVEAAYMYYIYTTTTQCKLLKRKYGICASGWKEKHHQRKLQWVKPPRVQVKYLCQLLREKHHHRKLVLATTTVRTRCKGQGAGGVHNAAIIVTCVRVQIS